MLRRFAGNNTFKRFLGGGETESSLHFDRSGTLSGTVGTELTARQAVELGLSLATAGKTALGWSGGGGAAMLAEELCGFCLDELSRLDE